MLVSYPYNFETLESDIQAFLLKLQTSYELMFDFFTILNNTGLRFQELKQPDNKFLDNENNIQVVTLKGSNTRTIPQESFTNYFIQQFSLQRDPYWILTNKKCNHQFTINFPNPIVYHKTKRLKAHLFRHAFAKRLSNNGYSDIQIQEIMGEVDLKNAQNYIYSELTYLL